jgi:type IV secretory pathway TrbL component
MEECCCKGWYPQVGSAGSAAMLFMAMATRGAVAGTADCCEEGTKEGAETAGRDKEGTGKEEEEEEEEEEEAAEGAAAADDDGATCK